jgi:short-subunit dehydrogenase
VSKYFGRAFNYGIFSQKKGEIMVKRVLITGASSGIGEEFARQMARDGYQVTAIARREDKLKALCTDLGNGHDYQVIDLAKMDDVKRLQQHLQNEKYDILINNAGFGYYDNFSKQDEDTLVELLDVNIKALVLLSQAFLKKRQKRRYTGQYFLRPRLADLPRRSGIRRQQSLCHEFLRIAVV